MVPSHASSQTLDRAGREGGHVVEMQRRRLLLAFAESLAEDGLEGVGVGRICKRAGVSRRTFYDLFSDREACFLAVLDETVERVSQSVLAARSHEGRWRERVRTALTVLLEFFDAQPVLARVCAIETLKAGPAVSERRRQVIDMLVAAVDRGRSESKDTAGPPPLTAQSTVGGAVSIVHARLAEHDRRPLIELLNPLMSMIVHPYLGPAAARRELDRPAPQPTTLHNSHPPAPDARDPFRDLPLRITYRTARVLAAIAAQPDASNRQIADTAEVPDQGQISKLLRRLQDHQLIENNGQGHTKGEPNAWTLTQRGQAIQHAIGDSSNL